MLASLGRPRALASLRALRSSRRQFAAAISTTPLVSAAENSSESPLDVDKDGTARPATFPANPHKVVLLENIHPKAVDIFEKEGYTVELYKRAMSGAELAKIGGDANLIGIRSKTHLDADFFDTVGWHKHRLWAVGCFCIGTNQVNLAEAANHGVPVFNAPFSNTRSVAEKTLSEIIALHRKLYLRSTDLHNGIWKKSATGSHEVRGTTLGIVGYGRIGSQISVLAELLGMRVLFYDVIKCLPLGNAHQVDSFEELLRESDCVTLHVPATKQTSNMINAETIAQMKDGAFLINNARGSVVDVDALAAAIKSGKLGGATVDVFPSEPAKNGDPFDTPLRGLPNVSLSPHIGGSTEEAQENIAVEVASKLVRYMNSGATLTSCNTPELDMEPLHGNTMRILNFHQNVPGVLGKINTILSDYGVNVTSQYLKSNPRHSYIALEVDKFLGKVVTDELKKIKETIAQRELV